MNNRILIGISTICFAVGICWYAIYSERLIIRFSKTVINKKNAPHKKNVALFFYTNHTYKQESVQVSWLTDDLQVNLSSLVHTWTMILHEEQYIKGGCALQSVLIDSATQTAYLSFDQLPLIKDGSIHTKWHCIEGLLKTVRAACPTIMYIQFLCNHEPVHDPHLDFSFPWPVQGFLK